VTSRLVDSTFRAGSGFALVPVERLAAAERDTLVRMAGVPALTAVLVPTERRDGSVKLIDRDTAALLAALREPGPIPATFRPTDGHEDLLRLVLDGILEVEVDGRFVAGPRAYATLTTPTLANTADGRLARLSMAALACAQTQPIDDAERLAAKLYFANRLPVSRELAQRWPDAAAVRAFLGAAATALERTHRRLPTTPDREGWIIWSRSGSWRSPTSGTPKLYVSPLPDDLPAAFAAIVPEIARMAPPLVKVGSDAFGVSRPDKLVLYFDDVAGLHAFAQAASDRLTGIKAHGVPFSAELAGDGLLSWGVDPPRDEGATGLSRRESWRTWVVGRLAHGLIAGRGDERAVEPWRFALSRLELDGVDTATWQPRPSLWGEQTACV
jgi:hypothetical protein